MDRKSLIVIPFTNVSQSADDEYFSDGITDELLVTLHKIKGVKILSRTSSYYLKNKQLSLPEIADIFGVEYILEGGVRKTDISARITMQLIEIANETVLISEVYEIELADILKVQSTIAEKIAEKLRGVFETSAKESSLTQNPRANEHYLKGNYHWYRYTKAEIELAVIHFLEAIKIEPHFALAYAGLAKSYVVLGAPGFSEPATVFPKAKKAAQKAILINNKLVEPHLSAAWVSMFYDGKLKTARKHLDQALRLNPNYAATYASFVKYYLMSGQLEKAEDEALRAIEIDPLVLPYHADLFRIYFYMRRYDDAIKVCKSALEIDSDFRPAHAQMGWIYIMLGEFEQAINMFSKHQSGNKNIIEILAGLSYAYARSGFTSESRATLEQLKKQYTVQEKGAVSFQMAIAHIGLRNYEEAYTQIQKAIDSKLGIAHYELLCNPVFHQLKSEHKFANIFRSAILVEDVYPKELSDHHEPEVITIHTNTKEKILLDPRDLLFAEADNNYTQIHWKEGHTLSSKLLRINLAQLQRQLAPYPFITRAHKSFLLSVQHDWVLKGNAKGYTFKSVLSPTHVPVSRSKVKVVLALYDEYSEK